MPEPVFPILNLLEAQHHLRRPFASRALKWKIQTSWPKEGEKKGGLLVAYIDARLVIERLDTVVGPRWSDHYELIPGTKAILCELTIDGVTRSDVGESTHSVKGTVSDALKRAAVHFGIGLSVYAMSQVRLNATPNGSMAGTGAKAVGTLTKMKRGNKHDVEIGSECEAWLRGQYERWLASGKNRYGLQLDHGGDDDAVGLDPADEQPPAEEGHGLELAAAVDEVQKLFDGLTAEQRKKRPALTPAKFKAQLASASESADGLTALEAELKERAK